MATMHGLCGNLRTCLLWVDWPAHAHTHTRGGLPTCGPVTIMTRTSYLAASAATLYMDMMLNATRTDLAFDRAAEATFAARNGSTTA